MCLHWDKYIAYSFQFEGNMIAVTIFFLIMNQTDFRLDYNQKEIIHYE